jgi:hypothetical protein
MLPRSKSFSRIYQRKPAAGKVCAILSLSASGVSESLAA